MPTPTQLQGDNTNTPFCLTRTTCFSVISHSRLQTVRPRATTPTQHQSANPDDCNFLLCHLTLSPGQPRCPLQNQGCQHKHSFGLTPSHTQGCLPTAQPRVPTPTTLPIETNNLLPSPLTLKAADCTAEGANTNTSAGCQSRRVHLPSLSMHTAAWTAKGDLHNAPHP